jgi:O-antigen/teichoic acid export membrane protein
MNWASQVRASWNDPVRLVQLFMVCRHGGVLLLSVVMARVLPVSEVGVFEMLLLTGYLVTFFWSDALVRGFLARYGPAGDKKHASSFLWLHFLAGAVLVLLLVMGSRWLIPLFTGQPSLDGLVPFAIYQVMVMGIWVAPFTGIFTLQQLRGLSLFVLAGPAAASLLAVMVEANLSLILTGLCVYAGLGWIWVASKTFRWRLSELSDLFRGLWKVSWPLMLYAISTGLARSFDSWLVARQFDEATFAVFRYGAREFPVVVALAGGLSTMMIPKLADRYALEELRTRSMRLMHICYPMIALLMLLSTPLFVLLFGTQYREGGLIFNIYLLLTLTQLIFPQSVITARKDTILLWYVSIAELAVNILASLVLLSYFGLAGIAMGTVVAFAFEKCVLFFLVQQKYNISLVELFKLKVWSGYALLLIICFIAAQWMYGM